MSEVCISFEKKMGSIIFNSVWSLPEYELLSINLHYPLILDMCLMLFSLLPLLVLAFFCTKINQLIIFLLWQPPWGLTGKSHIIKFFSIELKYVFWGLPNVGVVFSGLSMAAREPLVSKRVSLFSYGIWQIWIYFSLKLSIDMTTMHWQTEWFTL